MSWQLNDSLDESNVKHFIKYIEHKHQILTFGFCRMNATIDRIIPDPIINICLIYAFMITEYFKYNLGNMYISDDKRTATNSLHSKKATFGAFIINCDENNADIYTWKIKINSEGIGITIGVDEVKDDHKLYSSYYWSSHYHHYAYSNVSEIFRHKCSLNEENIINLGRKFFYWTDDIITMVIDSGRKTVDFYKNDEHVYQCKNVHPNQYRLGIELCADGPYVDKEASVTLKNFSIKACD